MTDSGFDAIYRELLFQHGGDQLSVTERAICHRLARLLASDGGSVADIASLREMLPPKTTEPLDLSRLTDRQLAAFHHLVLVATPGQVVPPRLSKAQRKRERQRENKSRRFRDAMLLIDLLDRAEARGARLGEGEKIEVHNLFLALLMPAAYRTDIFWSADTTSPPATPEPAVAAPASSAPAGNGGNVLPFDERAAQRREASRLDALMTVHRD